MSDNFRVAPAVLQAAAKGLHGLTDELNKHQVKDLNPNPHAIGHAQLAATVADFCSRWQYGVYVMSGDCSEIADRLDQSAAAYLAMDRSAADVIAGIVENPAYEPGFNTGTSSSTGKGPR
jgi:hypothetical protein